MNISAASARTLPTRSIQRLFMDVSPAHSRRVGGTALRLHDELRTEQARLFLKDERK